VGGGRGWGGGGGLGGGSRAEMFGEDLLPEGRSFSRRSSPHGESRKFEQSENGDVR